MARRLALLLALLLCACGQQGGREPFIDSRLPPSLGPRFYPPEGWAWGLVQAGDFPAQRYGVSTTRRAPVGHVLILTGYGDSAEAWFETAGDLNRRGYTVWVLEGAGQAGSGHFALPRDVGHVPSLEPDLMGVKAMLRVVIPSDNGPVIVLGQGDGGLVGLLAARRGWIADGLILSQTRVPPTAQPLDEALARVGLGWVRDPREPGWVRDAPRPAGTDALRGAVPAAWRQANPDLRMGGPSMGRRVAFAMAGRDAVAALPALEVPTLLLGASGDLNAACAKAAACATDSAPGTNVQLQPDGARGAWLRRLGQFMRERGTEGLAPQGNAPVHGE